MCRPGDKGPYAVGNVRVVQVEDNVREAHEGSQHSAASIAKMSRVQMGHPVSAATRDKLRYPRTEKYKEGLRAIAKLRPPPTKKTRARMSEKHTRNWQEFGAAYYGR